MSDEFAEIKRRLYKEIKDFVDYYGYDWGIVKRALKEIAGKS